MSLVKLFSIVLLILVVSGTYVIIATGTEQPWGAVFIFFFCFFVLPIICCIALWTFIYSLYIGVFLLDTLAKTSKHLMRWEKGKILFLITILIHIVAGICVLIGMINEFREHPERLSDGFVNIVWQGIIMMELLWSLLWFFMGLDYMGIKDEIKPYGGDAE